MNKLCFILFISLIAMGCKSSLRDKIEAKIQEKCKDTEICKIDLKEVTDFKWDRLYIFEQNVVVDTVPGFPYHYIGDDSRQFFL